MAVLIQLRGGSAAEGLVANPVLAEREVAIEMDTGLYKVGDGVTHWNDLPYAGALQPIIDLLSYTDRPIPVPPAPGVLQAFGKSLGGRMLLRIQGPSGLSTPLQPSLFQNFIACLSTGVTTTITTLGMTSTNTGTISHPTMNEQYGYMANAATPTTLASSAGIASNPAPLLRGTTPGGSGGFFVAIRLAVPDASYMTTGPNTGSRVFAGITSTTMATQMASDNPNIDYAGFQRAHTDAGRQDVNWQFAARQSGGAGGSTLIDTGLPFVPQRVYDVYLFAPAQADHINWRIDNVNDGITREGVVVADAIANFLPDAMTPLRPLLGLFTVDAVVRNIRMQRIYVEADR